MEKSDESLSVQGINEFLPEQELKLGLFGQKIFTLRGQFKDDKGIATNTPILSEIAINTKNPFLKGSDNKTFAEQKALASKFVTEMAKKIPGIKGVIFQASDLKELNGRYLDSQAEEVEYKTPLFKYEHFPRLTRVFNDGEVVTMGSFNKMNDEYVLNADALSGVLDEKVGLNGTDRHVFLAIGIAPSSLNVPAERVILPQSR